MCVCVCERIEVIKMAYENKYPTSKVLRKLMTCLPQSETTVSAPFPYLTFKRVMKLREDVEPVISYERTIKQLYQDLIDFDFVSEGTPNRIYLDKVRNYLSEMGA